MPDRAFATDGPSFARLRRGLCLVGMAAALAAVGQYLVAARLALGGWSAQQLLVAVLLTGLLGAAASARWVRLGAAMLLPLAIWHIAAAYWDALHGAAALPATYRFCLLTALTVGLVVLPLASLPDRWLSIARRPAIAGASFAVAALAAEFAVSLAEPPLPIPRKFARDGKPIMQPMSPVAGYPYLYRPNAPYREEWADNPRGCFDVRNGLDYAINSAGLRGAFPQSPHSAAARRLLFLGDSFTFGEGIRDADTLPEQVGRQLRSREPRRALEVINAGVGGFDTRNEVALYRDRLASLEPDTVVVVMGLNDAPGASANRTYPRWFDRLARLSSLALRLRGLVNRLDVLPALRAEAFEPCFAALVELRAALRSDQRLLVALYPCVDSLHAPAHAALHTELIARLSAAGFDALDLRPPLLALGAVELRVHPAQDAHPNELAHAAAAAAIAERLANLAIPQADSLVAATPGASQ